MTNYAGAKRKEVATRATQTQTAHSWERVFLKFMSCVYVNPTKKSVNFDIALFSLIFI
jgi:hypothetical protein